MENISHEYVKIVLAVIAAIALFTITGFVGNRIFSSTVSQLDKIDSQVETLAFTTDVN